MESVAGLYLAWIVGVVVLVHLVRLLPFILGGVVVLLFLVLRWTGRHAGRALARAWWLFHRCRLGEAEFARRQHARYFLRLAYIPAIRGAGIAAARMRWPILRPFLVLRWRVWALYMGVLCALFHARVQEFYERECRRAEAEREAARKRAEEEAARQERAREDPEKDLYDLARQIFELPEDFTEQDLKRAYRRVMQWAHPDKGGTHEDCLGVIQARDYIRQYRGWMR